MSDYMGTASPCEQMFWGECTTAAELLDSILGSTTESWSAFDGVD